MCFAYAFTSCEGLDMNLHARLTWYEICGYANGTQSIGANLDFPKYFEKYDRLVRKEKFPEIYHTCDKILLFIYEYSSQSYCAHSAHVALVDDR